MFGARIILEVLVGWKCCWMVLDFHQIMQKRTVILFWQMDSGIVEYISSQLFFILFSRRYDGVSFKLAVSAFCFLRNQRVLMFEFVDNNFTTSLMLVNLQSSFILI